MSQTIFVQYDAERPPFYQLAWFLWGRDVDFDSDGNSVTPDASDWTELTVARRPDCDQRVDVDPAVEAGRVLKITGSTPTLSARAAWFIATTAAAECPGVQAVHSSRRTRLLPALATSMQSAPDRRRRDDAG